MSSIQTSPGSPDEGDLVSSSAEHSVSDRAEWYLLPKRRVWRPPTDVYETDGQVVVKVEIAGVSEDDFQIAFAQRRLVISGCRRDPVGKLIYQNMEIRYGEFRTEVWVGWALDAAAIEASYEAGFLYVYLPKRAREHHVTVRVPEAEADNA